MHFGQIFTGTEFDIETGLSKSKDTQKDGDQKTGTADSKGIDKAKEQVKKGRYLMVYAVFDPKLIGEGPQKPSEPKKPNGLVEHAPAPAKAKTNSKPPATTSGNKQSSNNPSDDSNLLALALADAKTDSKSTTTVPPKSPATKALDKTKPTSSAKSTAQPKPATKSDSRKAEYEQALSKYKKDIERYENDKSEYEKKLKNGEKKVKDLNDRFGPWYYVISAESFENLRLTHAGLVKPKENPAAKKGPSSPGSDPLVCQPDRSPPDAISAGRLS